MKIPFFFLGGGGWVGGGVRVDVYGEVKLFVKIQKKKKFLSRVGGGGSGWICMEK